MSEEFENPLERQAFNKWLERTCQFVRRKLMADIDQNDCESYTMTITVPDKMDKNTVYEIAITARRRNDGDE